MVGIVGYGVYIPRYRLKLTDIADTWKKQINEMREGLMLSEKSVPNYDEDAITIAIEASLNAIKSSGITADKIQSIFFGSESHPYAVNPSSTVVGDALGVGNNYFAADLEFACKGGTVGVQATIGFLESGMIEYGLAIGADAAQSKPHDVLEYTAGSGGCALILGKKENEIIAEVLETSSFTSNTPDFWRREGVSYPSHFGRFTGKPAYFAHVLKEADKLLNKSKLTPKDFDYCVFHMPNGKFPRVAAKKLGFTDKQLEPSLVVENIGNPYSASSLIGLSAVLDIAKPNQKIFFVSYGSGAGADGFIYKTTKNITKTQKKITPVSNLISKKIYISYLDYIKQTHRL